MGATERTAGHHFERQMAQEWRMNGWPGAHTSRAGDRSEDAAGNDVCGIGPFRCQCKRVERLGSHHVILDDMTTGIDGEMNVLFHKRKRQGTVVSMRLETFWRLLRRAFPALVVAFMVSSCATTGEGGFPLLDLICNEEF